MHVVYLRVRAGLVWCATHPFRRRSDIGWVSFGFRAEGSKSQKNFFFSVAVLGAQKEEKGRGLDLFLCYYTGGGGGGGGEEGGGCKPFRLAVILFIVNKAGNGREGGGRGRQ